MKTLEELNQKVWYRLLKVIYVLFFLLIFCISILIIVDNGFAEIDTNNIKIVCLDGNKTTFLTKDIDISLSKQNFIGNKFDYDYYVKYDKIHLLRWAIFKQCDYKKVTMEDMLADKYLGKDAFEIIPKYTYTNSIKKIILSVLIIGVLFELFRRIFYYIVLGKVIPNKK